MGLLAAALAGVSACAGPQSMLDPAGSAAQTTLQITWVLFVGATLIWLLMLALFAIALSRRRGMLRRPVVLIAAGGLAFPTAVLLALLIYGTIAGQRIMAADATVTRVIQVTGQQWRWQFDYLDDNGGRAARSIDRLVLPVDETVEFHVGSDDVIHSFWIPRLGGKIDAIPGRLNRIRLRATQTGRMSGQCAEFCGRDHAHMRFAVEVVEPDVFVEWLATQTGSDEATPP